MKRLILFTALAAPLLMCFQCGCDEPDTITILQLENATGEDLYWSRSAQPWANADCRWTHLPCPVYPYFGESLSAAEQFKLYLGNEYMLIVDGEMQLRASWPTDSLPMADNARWVSDTTLLETTNCNGIHPTQYTHTFTLAQDDLQ